MNYNSTIRYSILIALAATVSSCGSTASDNENVAGTDTAANVNSGKDTKAQNVFYSIPSPIETTSLLKAAGAKYNASYLNPIENVSKYSTAASRALNLGIYGSDLSFTSIFDQTQESMLYLRCTNKLATSLGISGAFDESTTSRIESNLENRDSLLTIISDSYWNADSYLKENGQPGVSALIIAGGWIEGLYIATKIAGDTKNADIVTRIGEQKLSLDNLVALLESYKSSNDGVNDMYNQFSELKKIYDTIPAKPSETTTSTDKKSGVTTIGNNSSYILTPEQLKAITDKANQIRNKIIQ
ncbi:MAG: hypothetical protein JWP12_3675 [Bacteroidetes bacterium]|nr:hypothetical protein [Bacteroidota bacterium]